MNNEDLFYNDNVFDVLNIRGNPFAEAEFKQILKKNLSITSEEDLDKVWNIARTFRRIKVDNIEEFAMGILKKCPSKLNKEDIDLRM